MKEKDIERRLVLETKRRGGLCLKWVCPGFDGVPDRLVFLPGGRFAMVELKAPGGKPRPLQASRHRMLRSLGFKVFVVSEVDQIPHTLDEIQEDNDGKVT